MGINNTKLSPNTEDWNNINTADMSSADMKLVNLRSDAQILVSILQILNQKISWILQLTIYIIGLHVN